MREIELPYDVTAPAVARTFVAEHGARLSPDVVQDAELLVSELVTNALRYGQPGISVRLRPQPPVITVAVADTGEVDSISVKEAGPGDTEGRGLLIVDALANSWGVTPREPPPGKSVWFEVGERTEL